MVKHNSGNAAVVKVGTGMRDVRHVGLDIVSAERIAREMGEGFVAVNLAPKAVARLKSRA